MDTSTMDAFKTRCDGVSAIFESAGASVAKAPNEHAVTVSRDGASVSLPIVTDERDWRATTAAQALFAALSDLFVWASARPGETQYASLDAIEKTAIPLMRHDLDAETERLRALAQISGGMDTVRRAWQAAGIDAAATAAIE